MNTIKRPSQTVSDFFSTISQIRDVAHLTHLYQKDKKISTHLALKTLYKAMPELVDQIIESWQGIYDQIDYEIPPSKRADDPIKFVQDNYDYIQKNRYIFNESWIQNMIDEIAALLAQTLFRLKFVQ
jgi:hypothetical protein